MEIIDLHINDLPMFDKPIRRSKSAALETLKISLGGYKLEEMNGISLYTNK